MSYTYGMAAVFLVYVAPALGHGLPGLLLRVHGGRNKLHAGVLEPARCDPGRELLRTVWSPAVSARRPP
jgi:hypothetical protein